MSAKTGMLKRDVPMVLWGTPVILPAGTAVHFVDGNGGTGGWVVSSVRLLVRLTGNSHDPMYRFCWVKEEEVIDGHFVIRSMTTTDAFQVEPIKPYHVYLLPVGERSGAYWGTHNRAMKFATVDAALEHGRLALKDKAFDVVPFDDRFVPTYWEARKQAPGGRVIGTEIVGAAS